MQKQVIAPPKKKIYLLDESKEFDGEFDWLLRVTDLRVKGGPPALKVAQLPLDLLVVLVALHRPLRGAHEALDSSAEHLRPRGSNAVKKLAAAPKNACRKMRPNRVGDAVTDAPHFLAIVVNRSGERKEKRKITKRRKERNERNEKLTNEGVHRDVIAYLWGAGAGRPNEILKEQLLSRSTPVAWFKLTDINGERVILSVHATLYL